MKDKRIRMVALDLDGTTLNNQKAISEKTVEAFGRAMEKGVHIVISTGRTFQSLPRQLFTIKGLEYVVTSNGAHITELANLKRIYENYIPAEAVEEIAERLEHKGFSVEAFVDGYAYIDKIEFDAIAAGVPTFRDADYILETRNPVEGIFDFMRHHKGQIENISVNFQFQKDREALRHELSQVKDTTLTSSFPHNFEIGGKHTSKGQALLFLMERLGLSRDELMACGDSPNDEEMIYLAGIGVAMENGEASTKEIADYITDTNDRDGVAKAIEKFVL